MMPSIKSRKSRDYFLRESCNQECHTLPLNFPSETLVYNMSAAIEKGRNVETSGLSLKTFTQK